MNILCICLGNICRSPMAEGLLLRHLRNHQSFIDWNVDSCGTNNYHKGELADHRMRLTALKNGIELIHRSRQITLEDFENFDLLLVMDQQNLSDVLELCPSKSNKVMLMSDLSTNYLGQIIPDPYFGEQKGFDEVYELLDHICGEIVQNFKLKY